VEYIFYFGSVSIRFEKRRSVPLIVRRTSSKTKSQSTSPIGYVLCDADAQPSELLLHPFTKRRQDVFIRRGCMEVLTFYIYPQTVFEHLYSPDNWYKQKQIT